MKLVFIVCILILPLQLLIADSDQLSTLKEKVLSKIKDEKLVNEDSSKVFDEINNAIIVYQKECHSKSKKYIKECIEEIQNFRRKVYLRVLQNKSDYLDDKDIEYEESNEIEKVLTTTISP
jgi:hypothetical protein